MQQFIAGFILACLAVVPLIMLYLRKNRRISSKAGRDVVPVREKSNQQKPENDAQIEELGKLVGELAHEIKNPLSSLKINLELISEDLRELDLPDQGGT